MKSSSFIPCVSLMQLVIGLSLLGIYESYKVAYINDNPNLRNITVVAHGNDTTGSNETLHYVTRAIETPLDWLFYLAIFNNVFCLFFCLAGVLNALKELIAVFSVFNAIHVVLTFHFFVDVWTDARIRNWSHGNLGGHEKAATAFLFFNFTLSFIATIFAVRSLQEIRHKAREEYNRLSVISDNLQFETDNDKF